MDTRPEKMTEQEELLELQLRASKQAKIFDIINIATIFGMIFLFAVLVFVIPDKDFSEEENRVLQQFPALSSSNIDGGGKFDRFLDGIFTEEIAVYYADQFPMRDYFIGIKGIVEIGLFKRENNGVILANSGYLVPRENITDLERLHENTDSAAVFADVMKQMDIPFNLAVAGRTFDVLQDYLPANFPRGKANNIWDYIKALSDLSSQLKYINLLKPIQDRLLVKPEQLYYKTDHHWTTLGAYYAYAELMKTFKEDEAQPLSFFTRETASDNFYGTTWSKAGMKWVEPDKIEYFRYEGDEDYITEIVDTGKSFDGFYDRSYLEIKDKYSSFIGGNNGRVDVTKKSGEIGEDGEPRKKLLLMKDSFAHCIVPFLAYHYDLVILDMRYYTESVARLVVSENIDRVLILNNVENLMNTNLYGILNYGIDAAMKDYEIAVEAYIKSQLPIKNIYINGNSISEYKIICPDTSEYIESAELIAKTILDRAGVELEIVATDMNMDMNDEYGKAIVLSNTWDTMSGLIEIAVEGDALIFRSTSREQGIEPLVRTFITNYLRDATGSFNFGEDFRYQDITDDMVMIMPE